MINAIIFDLDGVLVHTDEFHYLAWKNLADKLGIPFDRTINNRLLGVSRMDSLNIILENAPQEYTEERKLQFATVKNEIYKKYLATMSPADVSEEVRQTLTELRFRGYKLAVGSGSKNAQLILKQVGLEEYFDAVVDGTELSRGKPDPEVFLKAAQKLKVHPECCVVVEDAESGIDAAIAGKMMAVAIGNATNCGKAIFNLTTFSQLTKILH